MIMPTSSQNKWVFSHWLVIGSSFLIMASGLLVIFSTTSAEVLDLKLKASTHQALMRQLLYAFMGIALGAIVWKIGYLKLLEWSPYIMVILCCLLLLVLIPGVGKEVNGSKRWLNIFGISFQPSEFVKYFLPAFFIHRYLEFCKEVQLTHFLKLLGLVGIPMGLILIEPNNGTTAVIGATLLVVFFLMQVPSKYWLLPLGCTLLIGILFASHLPYVQSRLSAYLHPETDLQGKGHQPYQAKIAAGSGGLWGKGPGNSLQKLSYLPEAQNDYIVAIFAEEWGFSGILGLIVLYLTFTFGGISIALNSHEITGIYFGGAIIFLIACQSIINMGVVSGVLPSTGLNLPLFSQGGSSLMANLMGIGILLSIPTNERK